MINRSIFTLIFLFSAQLSAMDEKQKPPVTTEALESQISSTNKPIILPSNSGITYIFNGSTTNNQTHNHATSASNSEARAQAQNTTTMKNIMSSIQENIAPLPHNLQGWATTHKLQIVVGTSLTAYALISAVLIQGNRHLGSEETWGGWKRHLSIEELHRYCLDDQKKQELTHNLIDTILNRYFKTRQPTNHIDPLVDFSNSLNQEMKIMNRYIMVACILQKSRLIKLFPTNDAKIAQAKEYRQRLQCIKQLFINSMAAYNLNQFLAPSRPAMMPLVPLATSAVPMPLAPVPGTAPLASAIPVAPPAAPAAAPAA